MARVKDIRASKFSKKRNGNGNGRKNGNGNGNGKKHSYCRKPLFEQLEPRFLLSADLSPIAAVALADGLDQFGDRIDTFLGGEDLLDVRIPFIVQVERTAEGSEQVAPTLSTLFSVAVDPDGLGPGGNNAILDGLDSDNDGTVDAGEFIQGWFFDKIVPTDFLKDINEDGKVDTGDFSAFLASLDKSLTVDMPTGTPDITISFDVASATDLTDYDTTSPIVDLMFDVDFKLTVSQNLAIDLGTQADAIKLLMYTDSKASPMIPVDTTLDFGFTFGVYTGGQELTDETLDAGDFFVRKADDLIVSAKSNDPDDDTTDIENFGFNLNIGFLGAQVSGGEIDFQAAIKTLLIDPDSPAVLGFTTDQYGKEQAGGVVTSFDAIPSEDLAHDAGFVLRIGNAGIATEVKILADASNDDLGDLVDDVNGALGTYGLGDLVEASLNGSDQLVFTLIQTTDTPLGFANESYSGTGMLSATPDSGNATYPFEYGEDVTCLLSVGGAVPKLVTVHFPDPAQQDIG